MSYISKTELSSIIKAVDPLHRGQRGQRVRLVNHLAIHPEAKTSDIRNNALISNISHVAREINDLLIDTGFYIQCVTSGSEKDQFGGRHTLHRWSVKRIQPSTNKRGA